MQSTVNIFWFRRDLRLTDNHGLYQALSCALPVLPIFIFDTEILDKLSDRQDARVTFIYDTLQGLKQQLNELGSDLQIFHGTPETVWTNLLAQLNIDKVYTNHDYEPYALQREQKVRALLANNGIELCTFKDHVIFEKSEVVKADGSPYTVFTPYSKKWKTLFYENPPQDYPSETLADNFVKIAPQQKMELTDMGFTRTNVEIPSPEAKLSIIKNYLANRDFPALNGTSRLGIHYRFGTISIREKALKCAPISETYLNELIWRDFYAMILHHFPHVEHNAFRKEYDRIEWRNDESEFEAWCKGTTGYPLVDAGMRELNTTGFMHNRVRMVVASFLTKHLLIDWRWGEAYFAEKLLDFDLASNNGGWQWAAGCGTDAAPYFRIFNPTAQQEKFDKNFEYIKQWLPEYDTPKYAAPIVEHSYARERCLKVYKAALSRS